MKNPGTYTQKEQTRRDKSFANIIKEDKETNKDSSIIKNTMDPTPTDVYVVYDIDQIHILGNEADLKDFESFVSTEPSSGEDVTKQFGPDGKPSIDRTDNYCPF